MKIKMPDDIQLYILLQCKAGNGIVELKDEHGKLKGRLEFDVNGRSKTIEDQVFIVNYIERLLTYCRKDVIIFFNEEKLDMLNIPKLLEYKLKEV
jgi:hypothetical protein